MGMEKLRPGSQVMNSFRQFAHQNSSRNNAAAAVRSVPVPAICLDLLSHFISHPAAGTRSGYSLDAAAPRTDAFLGK
jgi:hypothetical protein